MFHDAVELWLRLASEVLDVRVDKHDLMQYWASLDPKLDQPLPGKQRMKRLTEARVGLKHHGIRPSISDVHDFRDATASFLQEATSQVFHVSFTELSLIDLVPDEEIAGFLREANGALANGTMRPALDALAKAFHCLNKYLGDRVVRIPGRPPISVYRVSPPRMTRADQNGSLPKVADYVEANLDELRSRVSMLELGVDMSRFRRFSAFVPGVMQTMDGKLHIQRGPGRPAVEATDDEARDCFDFLLDTAVRLGDHMEAAVENGRSGGSI